MSGCSSRGPCKILAAHVSMLSQMEEFSRGVIDVRRLCSISSVTALSLFFAVRVVDAWRWE